MLTGQCDGKYVINLYGKQLLTVPRLVRGDNAQILPIIFVNFTSTEGNVNVFIDIVKWEFRYTCKLKMHLQHENYSKITSNEN